MIVVGCSAADARNCCSIRSLLRRQQSQCLVASPLKHCGNVGAVAVADAAVVDWDECGWNKTSPGEGVDVHVVGEIAAQWLR